MRALALAARWRGIAGAGLDAHAELHLRGWRVEIARDVGRQGFKRRRDVERVKLVRATRALVLQRREFD